MLPVTYDQVVDEVPRYGGPVDRVNRNVLAVVLSLFGLVGTPLAVLMTVKTTLSSSSLASKFENGALPPHSEAEVHSAQVGVVVAIVLVAVSAILAVGVIVLRPHILLQVVAGVVIFAAIAATPLLWFGCTLAF